MIETMNNAIFYIGYLTVAFIMISISIFLATKIYETLMMSKRIVFFIYGKQFERHLKDVSDEEFEAFLDKLRDKYRKDKTPKK